MPVQQFEQEAKLLERYKLHMQLREKFNDVKEGGGNFTELLELPEAKENTKVIVVWSPC